MRWWWLILLAGVSCRSRLEEIDVASDGGPRRDLGAAPMDLIAPVCRTHTHQAVPLASLSLADGPDMPAYGMAVRLRLGVPLRQGCDVLGSVEVDVQPGNATDFVRVVASVWRGSAGCGPTVVVPRIVVLDGAGMFGGNPRLSVRDDAPGGTASLAVELGPPFMSATCDPIPFGSACERDCQCRAADPGARCVPVAGTGDRSGFCVHSCSEDVDCPVVGQACQAGGAPPFACIPWAGEDCFFCQHDCPFGSRCQCVCLPLERSILDSPCQCDGDCGEGRLCSADRRCVTPCTTVADCGPSGDVCGGGACSSTR